MDDSKIISLYLERDESAIEHTDEKYGAYCKRIAYNILADEFDAEECKSDTYFKLWNAIPPTVPRIFSAFIAKITVNGEDVYEIPTSPGEYILTVDLSEFDPVYTWRSYFTISPFGNLFR